MHKAILAVLLAASATAAQAAVVNINFNNPTGVPTPTGSTQTYSNGGLSVTANGVAGLNGAATDLYGKNLPQADEKGLGINNDPTGQHEIWGSYSNSAIVLDVSDLLANNVTSAQFFMNSSTDGESWMVWAPCGANCWINFGAWNGSDEGVLHDLPDWGSYSEYAFTAGGYIGDKPMNVLLGGLALTQSVPEPATWAMMLLGFGAMGVAFRRRRRVTVTLPQLA